jgi:cell division protein FtsI/penicillin-binding protein 2
VVHEVRGAGVLTPARPSRDRINGGAGDWRALQQACELVVEAGTATMAKVPGITVAGKTGTAQNPHGEDHALFAGYAPADDPRIAFAFVIENSGHGGSIAAPRAGFVLKKLFADTTAARAAASLAVAVSDSVGGGGD